MEKEEKIKIYNIVEEIKGYQKEIARLKLENKELSQLKDNWNKLKEWIINRQKRYFAFDDKTLLRKMQELENGDSNE